MDDFTSGMVILVSFFAVYTLLIMYIQHRKEVRERQLQTNRKALERQEREARVAAVRQLKTKGAGSVLELLNIAREEDYAVRQAALEMLGDLGDVTVPYLFEAIRGKDLNFRISAIYAAAKVRNVSLVPDLLTALRDLEQRVSSAAACALGQTGDQSIIPDLLETLNHSVHRDVRWASAWGLGQLNAVCAIPDILSMLRNASGGEDEFLADILVQIGENAVSELVACLGDPDHQVQSLVTNILTRISTPEALGAIAAWRETQQKQA